MLNTDGDPEGIIRHGNERVLRARFNDARFFWQTDQKHPLRERTEWLKNVTFQKDLGSYYDKMHAGAAGVQLDVREDPARAAWRCAREWCIRLRCWRRPT